MSLPICGMFLRRNIGLDRLFNIPSNIRLRDILFVNMNGVSYSQLIDGAGGKCENIRSVVTTASGNQYPFPTPSDIQFEKSEDPRDTFDDNLANEFHCNSVCYYDEFLEVNRLETIITKHKLLVDNSKKLDMFMMNFTNSIVHIRLHHPLAHHYFSTSQTSH